MTRRPDAELREKHGSRGTQLFRTSADPNEVTVVFDRDHDAFRQCMASAEGHNVMQEAGLQGKPDPVFLEHVTNTASSPVRGWSPA